MSPINAETLPLRFSSRSSKYAKGDWYIFSRCLMHYNDGIYLPVEEKVTGHYRSRNYPVSFVISHFNSSEQSDLFEKEVRGVHPAFRN